MTHPPSDDYVVNDEACRSLRDLLHDALTNDPDGLGSMTSKPHDAPEAGTLDDWCMTVSRRSYGDVSDSVFQDLWSRVEQDLKQDGHAAPETHPLKSHAAPTSAWRWPRNGWASWVQFAAMVAMAAIGWHASALFNSVARYDDGSAQRAVLGFLDEVGDMGLPVEPVRSVRGGTQATTTTRHDVNLEETLCELLAVLEEQRQRENHVRDQMIQLIESYQQHSRNGSFLPSAIHPDLDEHSVAYRLLQIDSQPARSISPPGSEYMVAIRPCRNAAEFDGDFQWTWDADTSRLRIIYHDNIGSKHAPSLSVYLPDSRPEDHPGKMVDR